MDLSPLTIRRSSTSYDLERYFLAARRFFSEPTTAGHRRELEDERSKLRTTVLERKPTREDVQTAWSAAATQRGIDRANRLCGCWRCSFRRRALKIYIIGFKDGVNGRIGRRRLDTSLRSLKEHYHRGLTDGRRNTEEIRSAYEAKLDNRAVRSRRPQ